MSDNPLRKKLLQLAEDLIDEVNDPHDKSAVDVRVDVLKAACALYLGDERLNAKVSDEDAGGRNMKDWAREIRGDHADA
jgi:hypothetical protein